MPSLDLPSPSVHRYSLAIKDEVDARMPRGAIVLHVSAGYLGAGTNHPIIELWAHVEVDAPLVPRRFRIVGTGHLADISPRTHVGTVIHDLPGGRGVWHVFDLGERGVAT